MSNIKLAVAEAVHHWEGERKELGGTSGGRCLSLGSSVGYEGVVRK